MLFFCVLLTEHLSISLAIDQLNAQILVFFFNNLLYSSTCFEHCCAHQQEVKKVLYSIWYHHTLQMAVRYTGRPPTSVNLCIKLVNC